MEFKLQLSECLHGLSFDIALRLSQYNENGQFTKAASGYRTQYLT